MRGVLCGYSSKAKDKYEQKCGTSHVIKRTKNNPLDINLKINSLL